MVRFGYSEDDLLNSRYTPQFVELMRFECQRASSYYDLAREALQDEDKRFFFPARIMWSIYAHTLNRIAASDYNVFERRISIPKFLKLLITFTAQHQLKYSG
jgi:phytoene synthase